MRRLVALALPLMAAAAPAAAQEFGVYLICTGQLEAKGRTTQAHLDLALRRNNQTALVQRSNVLPVGDRMKFETSPAYYSMVYRAPLQGSVVWHDWLRGAIFVWEPDLKRLHSTRLSVDRQTAVLEGEMRDGADVAIGLLKMRCDPRNNETVAPPKF